MNKVTFGICADPHPEIVHDGNERLKVFLDEMSRHEVDFIVHLGDFCPPFAKRIDFVEMWNAFPKPHYHVLGNHEMQQNFTKQQAMDFLGGMPARYYSFDRSGFHFVVVDGNDARTDRPPRDPNFPSFIGPEQFEWLKRDLMRAERPCFLFAHQSLLDDRDVENADEVSAMFREVNQQAGGRKIAAVFCGHYHTDRHEVIDGIHLLETNSMSD